MSRSVIDRFLSLNQHDYSELISDKAVPNEMLHRSSITPRATQLKSHGKSPFYCRIFNIEKKATEVFFNRTALKNKTADSCKLKLIHDKAVPYEMLYRVIV
jgi:hypothetical protein